MDDHRRMGLAPQRRRPGGVAGFPPGCTQVKKAPSAGPCQPAPDDAHGWALVVGPDTFPGASAEWQTHAAAIEQFEREGASPNLVATLRRAVLAGLAER